MMTDRNRELLQIITRKTRYLTVRQIAHAWWAPTMAGRNAARRAAENLVRQGFLESRRLLIEPELELARPVHEWRPSDPTPNPWKIAHQLQERWTGPPRITGIYYASRKAARMFGGRGGIIHNPLQVTHDLHLSQVYLHLRAHRPEEARHWVSEDFAPHAWGEKVPDALIVDEKGTVLKVIEFGGKYDGSRVEKFHHHCALKGYPYELW